MAEVAGADPAGAGVASAAQGVDQDICEVERLLALSQRPVIAHRLAVFLSELQQVTALVAWSLNDVAIPLIVLPARHRSIRSSYQLCRSSTDSVYPWRLRCV